MNALGKILRSGMLIVLGAVILLVAGTLVRYAKAEGDEARRVGVARADESGKLLKGEGAYGDWREDAPGVRRLITPADMPEPFATKSAGNDAHVVSRPTNAWPQVLPGFKVDQIATGLKRATACSNGSQW